MRRRKPKTRLVSKICDSNKRRVLLILAAAIFSASPTRPGLPVFWLHAERKRCSASTLFDVLAVLSVVPPPVPFLSFMLRETPRIGVR